jgi:MFS family permease
VSAVFAYLRSLNPQLPRPVWLLEAGGVANSLGNGIVLPFLIIYLNQVREFSLATSGVIVATIGAVALVTGPFCGRLIDRIGPRATLVASLLLLAVGYGGFPFVREPWQAFVLAAIAGAGNGGFAPAHSSLLATLTTREQRNAAYAVQRATDNLGFGVGALVGGLIATTRVPESFTLLFLLDAMTFIAFIALLMFVPARRAVDGAARAAARYSVVLRDRVFLWLLLLIALLVAAAYAQVSTVLPPFATQQASISEAGVGVIFFVNTVIIVIAQLPIAKAIEGRRRMFVLALSAAVFAGTSVAILAAGSLLTSSAAVVALCGVIVVFSLAECLHGSVQNPLIADLAPEHLLGRYMALRTISWQVGFMAGPAIGSALLARSPAGLWLGAAAACAVVAVGSLALARRIPEDAAFTPVTSTGQSKALPIQWRTPNVRLDDPLSTRAKPATHQAPEAPHAHAGGRRPA